MRPAVGCRVKSGWGVAVLLGGPVDAPQVLDRRRLELSDPAVPESVQPYHAGFGTEQTDTAAVARLVRLVTRCAQRSVSDAVRGWRAAGHRPRRIGIVVTSTVDPASIANQHIRAHASEGRLFRTVVEQAARRHRLQPSIVLEQGLLAEAVRHLRRTPARIRQAVAELGRGIGGSWRAEDKSAALAAWLLLGRGPRSSRSPTSG